MQSIQLIIRRYRSDTFRNFCIDWFPVNSNALRIIEVTRIAVVESWSEDVFNEIPPSEVVLDHLDHVKRGVSDRRLPNDDHSGEVAIGNHLTYFEQVIIRLWLIRIQSFHGIDKDSWISPSKRQSHIALESSIVRFISKRRMPQQARIWGVTIEITRIST